MKAPRLLTDEGGLSTVEYILILVLLAIVGIVSWRLFGSTVGDKVEEARGGITTLDGRTGAPGGGAGGAAGGAEPGGRRGSALGPDDSVGQGGAAGDAPGESAGDPSANAEDRDPEATRRGSLQAGEGRVTPLRADGLPSQGDPSAGRGGGGMWKVLLTLFLVIAGFLAAIPLLARLRK